MGSCPGPSDACSTVTSVKENTATWKSGRLNTSFALAPYCAVKGINPILTLIFFVGKIEVIYGCSLKIKEHGDIIILASITEVSNFRQTKVSTSYMVPCAVLAFLCYLAAGFLL